MSDLNLTERQKQLLGIIAVSYTHLDVYKRQVVLYDLRTNSPTQKIVQTMRTNSICWNPMEAFNFVIANEDHNAYYYDMRNMSRALHVFKDHVSAVMDVDFSPTGDEIVTGSYDKTIRIYQVKHGHSREIYHTKTCCILFVW